MRRNRFFEQQLALHGAATLAGIKPASLICLSSAQMKRLSSQLKEYQGCFACKGISLEVLSHKAERVLLLVYRQSELEALLARPQSRRLLEKQGYSCTSTLSACLQGLRQRLVTVTGFPHEIGLFLGYPLADVCGFIENHGENFKVCGYWKVYADTDEAKKIFEEYSECSREFCRHWRAGGFIGELAAAV